MMKEYLMKSFKGVFLGVAKYLYTVPLGQSSENQEEFC